MYALIDENNVVIQMQPNEQDGFVKVHNSICCGMVHDGGNSYAKDTFSIPVIVKTWDQIRRERDSLLVKSDWTQLDDSPMKGNQEWLEYRQALRDITDDFDSADEVVWPTQP